MVLHGAHVVENVSTVFVLHTLVTAQETSRLFLTEMRREMNCCGIARSCGDEGGDSGRGQVIGSSKCKGSFYCTAITVRAMSQQTLQFISLAGLFKH